MIIEVGATAATIDLTPPTELAEIIQNVRTILQTIKTTVPLYRDFGLSGDAIDAPINKAKAIITDEIVTQVDKYEPRAQVVEVLFSGDATAGNLVPTVRIKRR